MQSLASGISPLTAWALLAIAAIVRRLRAAEPVARERISGGAAAARGAGREDRSPTARCRALAIVVVHDDEAVYLRGSACATSASPRPSTPTPCSRSPRCRSRYRPPSWRRWSATSSSAWDSKVADLDPAFRLHDPYPTDELTVRDLFAHRSGLPAPPATTSRTSATTATKSAALALRVLPSSSFRAGYLLQQFRADRRRRRGGEADRQALGRGRRGEALPAARHDLHQLAPRRLRQARQPGRAACPGRWQLGREIERQPDAQAPAGGVSSTVRDLSQWLRLELRNGVYDGKPLIAADALAQTHVPLMTRGNNPVTGSESFYGLGWNVEFGRHGRPLPRATSRNPASRPFRPPRTSCRQGTSTHSGFHSGPAG